MARFGGAERDVPLLGLGTCDFWQTDRQQIIEVVHTALDLGVTHIDTAESYGDTEVECILGEALAGRRHEAFLVSKVHPHNGTYANTVAACKASLDRLQTDYLDLYLLHWREDENLEETLQAFALLKSMGWIRAFGVSNFDVDDLEEARASSFGSIVCNQVIYHLGERHIEHAVMPWCRKNDIAVVGYSPFGGGEDLPPLDLPVWRPVHAIAEQRGLSPHQVMLAFLLRNRDAFLLVQTHDVDHLRANVAAADVRLTSAEIAAIDRAFPLEVRDVLPQR